MRKSFAIGRGTQIRNQFMARGLGAIIEEVIEYFRRKLYITTSTEVLGKDGHKTARIRLLRRNKG